MKEEVICSVIGWMEPPTCSSPPLLPVTSCWSRPSGHSSTGQNLSFTEWFSHGKSRVLVPVDLRHLTDSARVHVDPWLIQELIIKHSSVQLLQTERHSSPILMVVESLGQTCPLDTDRGGPLSLSSAGDTLWSSLFKLIKWTRFLPEPGSFLLSAQRNGTNSSWRWQILGSRSSAVGPVLIF